MSVFLCSTFITEGKIASLVPKDSPKMNIAATIPLPDDHIHHVLAAAHRPVYDQWVESLHDGDSDKDAEADADAIARVIALVPCRTTDAHKAKATVIRHRLGGSSMNDLIGARDLVDQRLVLSYAADALALAEQGASPRVAWATACLLYCPQP
jgi:hypothetical protein